ncbi:CCN family member 3-like [Temnothorax americanus]|uniref:CCN family member 3-like n=1 Tax=Temnothorax americanus TaxID=1964332 RepID=UPI0040679542
MLPDLSQKQCLLHGIIYDRGERVSPKQCVECKYYDGIFTCTRFDTDTKCPPPPCPPSEQLSVAEECCKFCPDAANVTASPLGHHTVITSGSTHVDGTAAAHSSVTTT